MSLTGIGEISELANTVINKIWPDKTEQEKAELLAAVQLVQGQLKINEKEAENPSVFVSGWRPFVGWCCGAACAWNWIGLPVAKTGLALAGISISVSPADLSEMLPILFGMLGIGGLRTIEKLNGKARV